MFESEGKDQNAFFIIVMATIVFLSASSSVLTASIFGLASIMPVSYIAAVMSGQALGGTIAALANIFSIAASSSTSTQDARSINISANIFFTSALFITVLGLAGYFSLFYLKFSKFYMVKGTEIHIEEGPPSENVDESQIEFVQQKQQQQHSIYYVLKRIWKWGFCAFMIFFVSLSCFPGIASLIKPVDESTIVEWFRPFFTPTVVFLCFNAADFAGRILAGKIQLLKPHHANITVLLTLVRIAFIPLVMQCNTLPTNHLPSINDSVPLLNDNISPVILITFLGLTNGYLGNLCMMYGPQLVNPGEAEQAGTIMSLFLTLGLAMGSVMSLILVKFL